MRSSESLYEAMTEERDGPGSVGAELEVDRGKAGDVIPLSDRTAKESIR